MATQSGQNCIRRRMNFRLERQNSFPTTMAERSARSGLILLDMMEQSDELRPAVGDDFFPTQAVTPVFRNQGFTGNHVVGHVPAPGPFGGRSITTGSIANGDCTARPGAFHCYDRPLGVATPRTPRVTPDPSPAPAGRATTTTTTTTTTRNTPTTTTATTTTPTPRPCFQSSNDGDCMSSRSFALWLVEQEREAGAASRRELGIIGALVRKRSSWSAGSQSGHSLKSSDFTFHSIPPELRPVRRTDIMTEKQQQQKSEQHKQPIPQQRTRRRDVSLRGNRGAAMMAAAVASPKRVFSAVGAGAKKIVVSPRKVLSDAGVGTKKLVGKFAKAF